MDRFTVKAAMPGNPTFYMNGLQDYSPEGLAKLKDMGFNIIFVNLAWSRPYIDVVVPEAVAISKSYPLTSDLLEVERNRKKFNERIANIKALGMKAYTLFGLPQYMDYTKLPETYKLLRGATQSVISSKQVTCVLSEETKKYYRELFEDFFSHVTDVDGLLVYTFDELAEICSEEGDCPRCHGISLETRIADFIDWIYDTVNAIKPGFDVWWEPWELTWSQVIGVLSRCNTAITVSCHSNQHEVYFVNHPDLWLRSIAGLCSRQGRNMVVELFLSGCGEDLYHCPTYPCPRLAFEQLDSVSRERGITGVKEYYGICQAHMGVNERADEYFFSGGTDFIGFISSLAHDYAAAPSSASSLVEAWELSSRILEVLPWELSWVLRIGNYPPYNPDNYGKTPFYELMRTPWDSPAWLSNRRVYYMVTRNEAGVTNTYSIDVLKRLELCFKMMDKVCCLLSGAVINERFKMEIARQVYSVQVLKLVLTCRYYHLMDTMATKNGSCQDLTVHDIRMKDYNNAKALLRLIDERPTDVPCSFNRNMIADFLRNNAQTAEQ